MTCSKATHRHEDCAASCGHFLSLRPPIYGALFLCCCCRNLHSVQSLSLSLSLSLSFRSNSCLAAFMLQSARLQASRIGGRTEGSTNSKRSDYLDVWITPGTICHAAHFAAESGGRAVHVYDTLRCLSPSRSRSPIPSPKRLFRP